MVIYVDIDGTICNNPPITEGEFPNYALATPISENIDKINKLYNIGHQVVYWTARGSKSGHQWFDLTIKQLKEWGAKFHELRMGKPPYNLIICDKSIKIEDLKV